MFMCQCKHVNSRMHYSVCTWLRKQVCLNSIQVDKLLTGSLASKEHVLTYIRACEQTDGHTYIRTHME